MPLVQGGSSPAAFAHASGASQKNNGIGIKQASTQKTHGDDYDSSSVSVLVSLVSSSSSSVPLSSSDSSSWSFRRLG